MATRPKFTDDDAPAAERPDPPRPAYRCSAHGCPVVTGREFCRFHAGQVNLQQITNALRRREWLITMTDFLLGDFDEHLMPDWAERAKALCERHGLPDLAPKVVDCIRLERSKLPKQTRDEAKHPKLYAQRLNAFLIHECVGTLKREPAHRWSAAGTGAPLSVGEVARGIVEGSHGNA